MKGLLLKDLYNMKIFAKSLLIIIAMVTIFGLMMRNPSYICIMIIFFSFSMSINGIALDEKANWDQYALTMPVSRKMLVLEKMLLALMFIVFGGALAVLVGDAMTLYLGEDVFLLNIGCVAVIGVVMVLMAILLPILFKFGAEKARYALIVIVMIPTIAIILIGQNLDIWITANFELITKVGTIGSVVVGILALVLSYFVCIRIFEKKEW